MDDNTAYVILISLMLGWIPILAIGKAISMVIDTIYSYKYLEKDEEVEED